MTYLSIEELLICRQVSKLWNKCAISRVRRTVPITLITGEQDFNAINDAYKSAELGSVVTTLNINSRLNSGLIVMLTRIGIHITDLEVQMMQKEINSRRRTNNISLYDLKFILELLPNLTKLTIRNLPLSLPDITFTTNTTSSKLVYIGLDQPPSAHPQYTKSFLQQLLSGSKINNIGILCADSNWNTGLQPVLEALHRPRVIRNMEFGGRVRSIDLNLLDQFQLEVLSMKTCVLDSNGLTTTLSRMAKSLLTLTIGVLIGEYEANSTSMEDYPLNFPRMDDLAVLNILCTRGVVIARAPVQQNLFPKLYEMAGNEYVFQKLFTNGAVYDSVKTVKLSFCAQLENTMYVLDIAAAFPNLMTLLVDSECAWCGIIGIITALPKLKRLVYTFGKDIKMRQWVTKQKMTNVLSLRGKCKRHVSNVLTMRSYLKPLPSRYLFNILNSINI